MFIAVYEFRVKEGMDRDFRQAWLEVTRAIHRERGSFGSRLHDTPEPQVHVAYAQWPDRARWESDEEIDAADYREARERMRACLIESRTVYELEVTEDYLQPAPEGAEE